MASEDSKALSDARSGRATVPVAPLVALSVALTLGALFLVGPLLWSVVPETPLPAPFPITTRSGDADVHRGLRAAGAGGGRGLGTDRGPDRDGTQRRFVLGGGRGRRRGPRPGRRVHAGLGRDLPGGWAGGARRRGGGRAAVAVVVPARAASERPWPAGRPTRTPEKLVRGPSPACCSRGWHWPSSISRRLSAGLLLGAIGVAGVLFVHERARLPTVPAWLGHTIDIVLVGLILLAVPNLFPLASGVPGTSLHLVPHPVPPELLPGARQPDPRRRRHVGRRALAVRGGLDLLPRGCLPGHPDRQRHAGAHRGWALGADVRRRRS